MAYRNTLQADALCFRPTDHTSGEGWALPLMSWERYPEEIPVRRAT